MDLIRLRKLTDQLSELVEELDEIKEDLNEILADMDSSREEETDEDADDIEDAETPYEILDNICASVDDAYIELNEALDEIDRLFE